MATRNCFSPSFDDVDNACNGTSQATSNNTGNAGGVWTTSANDGDTVIVPAGLASWTSTLFITKGICLQGNTVVTGAGVGGLPPTTPGTWPAYGVTVNADNAQTIIQDSVQTTTQKGLIQVNLNASQVTLANPFRITGFTFTWGGVANTSNSNNGEIRLICTDPANVAVFNIRIDHNYVQNFIGKFMLWDGWTYGCVDHNYFIYNANSQTANINLGRYGGGGQSDDNSWSDFPWFGTNQFVFFEDNTFVGTGVTGQTTSGVIDADLGGRFVARYNWCKNVHNHGGHGTETVNRSVRCREIYNNTYLWTIGPGGGVTHRGGTLLNHDNTWTYPGGTSIGTNITCYREDGGVRPGSCPWGSADGGSIWDTNDTEGNGTFVDGHGPHAYINNSHVTSVTGTNGPAPTPVSPHVTIFDTSQDGAWADQSPGVGHFVGYSIRQTTLGAPSYPLGSFIVSSTQSPFSITYTRYNASDRAPNLWFAIGDTYSVYRILSAMDQIGRGKTDPIRRLTGGIPVLNGGPNDGLAAYPHSAYEPSINWNNIGNGSELMFSNNEGLPSVNLGRTVGNDGIDVGTSQTDAMAQSIYVASLNGTSKPYTGPFVHPHPLVSQVVTQAPVFTSAASATFSTNVAFSFTVTTFGLPTVTSITKSASFPAGISYSPNSDGTATISSNGQTSTSNTTLTLTATNGISPDAMQSFNLIITSPSTSVIVPPGTTSFGSVYVGTAPKQQKLIKNTGNSILNVSGISLPTGFTSDWTGGIIQAASQQVIRITFSPTAVQSYNGTVTITSDATSGTNTFSITGTGVKKPRRRRSNFMPDLLK